LKPNDISVERHGDLGKTLIIDAFSRHCAIAQGNPSLVMKIRDVPSSKRDVFCFRGTHRA
jgi:hypothetical protein